MPALAFLASVGLALVAMLFAANAMLPDNGPVIVVSERIGLPEPWHPDPEPTSPPAFAPIPAPEMTSQAVVSTQPVSEAEGHAIKPAARTARAEAPPKKRRSDLPGSQPTASKTTSNRTTFSRAVWSIDFLFGANRAGPEIGSGLCAPTGNVR